MFEQTSKKVMVPLSDFALQVFLTDLYTFNLVKDAKDYMESHARSKDPKKHKAEDEELRGRRKSYYYGNLINKVIQYFYAKAESSIALRLSKMHDEYEESLKDVDGLDDEQRKAVIEHLLGSYKNKLVKKRDELLKLPKSRKTPRPSVTLDSKSQKVLRGRCGEDIYYKRLSKYIRALCEEYARLPDYEREEIFFAEEVKTIKLAIEKGKRLEITPTAHNSTKKMDHEHILIPYKILGGHVVGYTRRADRDKDTPYICPFLLSGLQEVNIYSDDENEEKEYRLSREQINAIEEAINLCDVAFCRQKKGEDKPLQRIKVKFTGAGLKYYSRDTKSIWRPRMEDVQDKNDAPQGIFSFVCRADRAKLYFTRYGKDAVIVEVASLSNERDEAATEDLQELCAKYYLDALNAYREELAKESCAPKAPAVERGE